MTRSDETVPVLAREDLLLLASETDAAFVAEAMTLFRQEVSMHLETLRANEGAGLDARRAVHTIGSSAALIGARRLAELCHMAEMTLVNGRPADCNVIAQAVSDAFSALDQAAGEFSA